MPASSGTEAAHPDSAKGNSPEAAEFTPQRLVAEPARNSAAREKAAREKAAREKAAREKAAREKAARDKAARDKAARDRARDKAEREAKVKAAIEQRELAVARLKADQDAARKRTEEARIRSQPTPAAPTLAVVSAPRPRSVKEICAGRNLISQAVCESRECGGSEHGNEALCKQILTREERRRELQN